MISLLWSLRFQSKSILHEPIKILNQGTTWGCFTHMVIIHVQSHAVQISLFFTLELKFKFNFFIGLEIQWLDCHHKQYIKKTLMLNDILWWWPYWISTVNYEIKCIINWFYFWCLMPLSAIFQLYHGDQF